jgi:hypothetical protein
VTAKDLDQDLIKHAIKKLKEAAKRLIQHDRVGPETAAREAIRKTRELFPPDWKLAVQGDNTDDFVEVWEVEHKRSTPIARVEKYKPPRRAYTINPSSPEVIKAFMSSRHPATEEGIQEFIAKHYGKWMQRFEKRHPEVSASDVWSDIIREFTEALGRHSRFED